MVFETIFSNRNVLGGRTPKIRCAHHKSITSDDNKRRSFVLKANPFPILCFHFQSINLILLKNCEKGLISMNLEAYIRLLLLRARILRPSQRVTIRIIRKMRIATSQHSVALKYHPLDKLF